MFQRLLIVALFVVIAIMVVRSIANRMNWRGWTGRGRSEIRGNWQVVEPLGRLGRTADRALRSALKLEAEDERRKVAVLFDVAHRAVRGLPLDPAELRACAGRGTGTRSCGALRGPRRCTLPDGCCTRRTACRTPTPTCTLTRSSRSPFRPTGRFSRRTPEWNCLRNERWRRCRTRRRRIRTADTPILANWERSTFTTRPTSPCSKFPSGALPDGAILPLLQLLLATEDERRPDNGVSVDALLARYGERICAGAVHCMIRPESTGQRGPTAYSPALFRLIGTWPRASAEPLFRAALESGWNDSTRFLPDAGWAQDLRVVFRDSPYGAPT